MREGYDIAIVQLQATTPQFTLLESGIIGNTEVIISGLSIDITKKLNVSLNVDNRWNSKVVFVAEPDGLQELVDAYKQSSGEQDVKLLPAANYTYSPSVNSPEALFIVIVTSLLLSSVSANISLPLVPNV